jgi:hypothetical protein
LRLLSLDELWIDDRAGRMSQLEEVGDRDGCRCWVCDEPVDPAGSVNDGRGPSMDSRSVKAGSRQTTDFAGGERLAHRACNTRKGGVTARPVRRLVDDHPALTAARGSRATGEALEETRRFTP